MMETSAELSVCRASAEMIRRQETVMRLKLQRHPSEHQAHWTYYYRALRTVTPSGCSKSRLPPASFADSVRRRPFALHHHHFTSEPYPDTLRLRRRRWRTRSIQNLPRTSY